MLQKFIFDLKKNTWKQITNVNTATYDSLALSKTERRYKLLTVRKCLVGNSSSKF
jgi:hypothetical protein